MTGDALFVAIDVGTTGARASAVDVAGELVAEIRRPYATSTPQPGWAQQDPRDWRESALAALAELTAAPGLAAERIRAVGLTGQCPTIAPFGADREPVGPGLLYRDNRATAQAAEMRRRIGDEAMHGRTGHIASAFHVGPKVLWLREHEPAVFAATDCFMQPRDVVLHALTGTTATDETHANSTVFFDLRERVWADDLLDAFSLDGGLFPAVVAPWQRVGVISERVAARAGLPADVPVVIGAADSQCAAFGSDVRGPGPISEMAGASSCLNSVVMEPSPDPRITHYSHVVPGCYSTELGVNVTGGALSWAVDRFALAGFDELEARAQRVLAALDSGSPADPRSAAPLFLPYLGDGERDDPALRAAFIGLSDRHGRDELIYAVLEAWRSGWRRPCRCSGPPDLPWRSCGSPGAARAWRRSARSRPTPFSARCGIWPTIRRRSASRSLPPGRPAMATWPSRPCGPISRGRVALIHRRPRVRRSASAIAGFSTFAAPAP